MTLIIKGPQGCGKTTHAHRLADAFGCDGVTDNWRPGLPIIPGNLHLTSCDVVAVSSDVVVLQFADARVHAAIVRARH